MTKDGVNSFIVACKSIMDSFGINIEEGNILFRESPFQADALIIVIGLTGDLHGQAIISMEQTMACKVASTMMGGMPAEMNEVTKSAVAELGNMIIGNAVTLLSKENVMLDITPPSVLTGDNIHISTSSLCISVPFNIEGGGIMEFSLSAKEITSLD